MDTRVRSTDETLGLEMNKSRFIYLDDLIPWFKDDYKLYELINNFWGLETKSRLIAVSKEIKDQSWKGLVSEWDSNTRLSGQLRVNKDLIEGLLDLSLGTRNQEFKLKELTQLELSIFENFFVELENFWKDYWRVGVPNAQGTYIYLIWVIELDNHEIGSLAIGVPPGIVPKNFGLTNKTAMYDFRDILQSLDISVPLDLSVGKSRLKIGDIRALEPGDLIVLENSSLDHIIWTKSEFERLHINIEIPGKDNSKFASMYYDGLEMANMAEENTNEDMLTDLPVELTAQFKSVQMPLQKIIELESGGILPLGLLMDSQLTLVAPGDRPIASGNLVIVGNQFGIKINKTNLKGHYPKAKLSSQAIDEARSNPQSMQQIPRTNTRAAQAQPTENFSQFDNATHDNLDQELEDIGIDPKELDELEDLY